MQSAIVKILSAIVLGTLISGNLKAQSLLKLEGWVAETSDSVLISDAGIQIFQNDKLIWVGTTGAQGHFEVELTHGTYKVSIVSPSHYPAVEVVILKNNIQKIFFYNPVRSEKAGNNGNVKKLPCRAREMTYKSEERQGEKEILIPENPIHGKSELKLRCYPNPGDGYINIELSHTGGILSVSDITGRIILKSQINEDSLLTVDLRTYNSGTYIARYLYQGSIITTKIILID